LNEDYTRGSRFVEIQGIVTDFLSMIRWLDWWFWCEDVKVKCQLGSDTNQFNHISVG
jgi:hypothetical protein